MIKHNETEEILKELQEAVKLKEDKESLYKPIPMEELLVKTTEREEIIKELLGEKEWGIITGFPKQGKTFFSLQLAYSLAEGEDFLNKFPVEGNHKVLFVSLEEDETGISSKLRDLKYAPSSKVFFLFPPTMTLLHLKEIIKENDFDVVIIDNLQMAWIKFLEEGLASYKEGSAYEVEYKRLAIWKEILAETNATFIFTHHKNKQGLYLGTTAIKGFFDDIIEMTPRLREGNKQVCLIELEARARKGKEFVIGREEAKWQYEGEAQDTQKEKAKSLILLGLFQEKGEWKRKEIVEALEEEGLSTDVIDVALKELVEERKLVKPQRGLYKLTASEGE
jgi:hypothetical protein